MKTRIAIHKTVQFAVVVFVLLGFLMTMCADLAFAKDKTIRILSREKQGESIEVLNKAARSFEKKHPGVKVEIEYCALGEIETKLIAAIQANRAYDAIQGPEDKMVANFAVRGLLLPLDDVVDALGRDDYIEGLLPSFLGHNYMIPYWAFGVGLWYRSDLFEQNGLVVPQTWDDMLTAARVLTKDKQYGYALIQGTSYHTNEVLLMFYFSNGGKLCDLDFNIVFDKEPYRSRMKETLEFYKKLKPYSPPGAVDYSWGEGQLAFAQGKVGMNLYWARQLANVVEHNPDLEPVTRQTHIPLGPQGKIRGGGGGAHSWVVMSQAHHPKLGKEFIKDFMSGENYIDFLLAAPGMYKPSRKSFRQNERWLSHPVLKAHEQDTIVSIEASRVSLFVANEWKNEVKNHWNFFASPIEASKSLTNLVHSVLIKGEDIDKAIDVTAKKLRTEMRDVKKTVLQEIGEENLIQALGKEKFEAAYAGIK